MTERWAPIKGYEGVYAVSDRGNVRSVDRAVTVFDGPRIYKKPLVGAPLARWKHADGYQTVRLWRENRARTEYVHRLVAEAFIGPCPKGLFVNHKNLRKGDNRVTNLEYVTNTENLRHAVKNGVLFGGAAVKARRTK